MEVAGGYVTCCFAIRLKKDLKVLKDLKALLRFIALKDRKLLKGGGGKHDFRGKVSNCWSSKNGTTLFRLRILSKHGDIMSVVVDIRKYQKYAHHVLELLDLLRRKNLHLELDMLGGTFNDLFFSP